MDLMVTGDLRFLVADRIEPSSSSGSTI